MSEQHLVTIENPPLAARIAWGFSVPPRPIVMRFWRLPDEDDNALALRISNEICANLKKLGRHALN